LAGETEVLGENLSHCHFLHRKPHMNDPFVLQPFCYGYIDLSRNPEISESLTKRPTFSRDQSNKYPHVVKMQRRRGK
jgi:hypothetical protein